MRSLTKSNIIQSDTALQPQLSKSKILAVNANIDILTEYIKGHGNPYIKSESGSQKLKNFATQVMVDPIITKRLLGFFKDAKEAFKSYHHMVYIEKPSLLHDKIKKLNLPKFDDVLQSQLKDQNLIKQKQKNANRAISFYLIAREKSFAVQDILSYDFTNSSVLYKGNYMSKTTQKSQLLHQLQKDLCNTDYDFDAANESAVMIDFLSFVRTRKFPKETIKTFNDFVKYIYNNACTVCACNEIHFIFDSHI